MTAPVSAGNTSFALMFEPAMFRLPLPGVPSPVATNAVAPPAFIDEPRWIVCASLESLRLLLDSTLN
ncbi:hypothetical protein [Caballeronia sp. LZ032]|uniref:hypothetical protein n=1 Tax=Caballeronia sp. LZ032 TaxID=3038565 RepID=UPI0028678C83|nr:hypothetical protein [Caballeronia sp. LZ032]MDR5883483.1 hypothetical protein [Caballeronia sp. LZ032]